MRSLLARVVVAVLVVGLARLGAWLLVAAVTSMVVVLVRETSRERRRCAPRRLAALAVLSAEDAEPQRKGVLSVLLRSVTEPAGSLERAKRALREDPSSRRRAARLDVLAVAEHMIETRPWLRPAFPARRWRSLVAWSLVTAGGAVLVALTRSNLVAVPFVAAFTATVLALTDLRRDRQWTPVQLAARASASAASQRPATELGAQAQTCSPATVGRAQRMLRTWDLDDRVRRDAQTLLELERRSASRGSSPRWRAVADNAAGLLAGAATWTVPL